MQLWKHILRVINNSQQLNYSMVSISELSLIDLQILRLKRKGLRNNLIAFVLFVLYFLITHTLGSQAWQLIDPYLKTFSHKWFIVIAGCVVHTLTAAACLLFFSPLYTGKLTWLDQYKIADNKTWHWNRPDWPALRANTIKHLLLAHFVYFPIGMWLSSLRSKIRFAEFPSLQEYFLQIMFLLYCEDIFFFLSHRMFHSPFFYKHIHKQHHEYDTTFAPISEYAHPLEYFLGNLLSSVVGIVLLGNSLHIFTYLMFIVTRVMNTNQVHSGVEILWSPLRFPPFSNSSAFHNFHHSKNSGAFASYTFIWDHLFGHDKDFHTYIYNLDKVQ